MPQMWDRNKVAKQKINDTHMLGIKHIIKSTCSDRLPRDVVDAKMEINYGVH